MPVMTDPVVPQAYPPGVYVESISPEAQRAIRPSPTVCWSIAAALVLVALACGAIAASIAGLSDAVRDGVAMKAGGK